MINKLKVKSLLHHFDWRLHANYVNMSKVYIIYAMATRYVASWYTVWSMNYDLKSFIDLGSWFQCWYHRNSSSCCLVLSFHYFHIVVCVHSRRIYAEQMKTLLSNIIGTIFHPPSLYILYLSVILVKLCLDP